jgi:hypothetical protein
VSGIGEFDWQNAFSSLVTAAPDIISASRPGGGYVPGQYQQQPFMPMQQQPEQRSGISTNTILLIGGAALAAFLIFKKK